MPPPASSLPSPLPSPSLEADPKEWERKSALILTAIRCFVDGLRSAPCLKAGLPRPTTGREDGKIGDGDSSGSLLAHLDSLGVLQQVQDLGQEPGTSTACAPPVYPELSLGALLHKQYRADERRQILHSVAIPLLGTLEHCYEALDKLPQAAQEELQSAGESAQSQSKASRNRRKNKAPPPLGMLSLNDYTNVACLLEFSMSISLVPFLEYPNVHLPPVPQKRDKDTHTSIHKINNTTTFMSQKRNQMLPKALAGRISKMALTWGTACAAENHDTLIDSLSTLVSGEDDNIHQSYLIFNAYQAYNEITSLATVVGHVLMLDRFRPMLLPRHLSDVYLMLLIAERLRWQLYRFDKQTQVETGDESLAILMTAEKATEKTNSQRLHALHKAMLFSPLMFPSSFISQVTIHPSSQRTVDCREAALAYRGLLGGGASMAQAGSSNPATPPWLRMRLGQCLTKLAHADLQSVVEVFVASAHGPGGEDQNDDGNVTDDVMTGAASRLARALCARPTKAPNSSSSNNVFEERLCSQFVEFLFVQGHRFLEEFNANAGNEMAQSRSSMAMHLTLWATISELPTENLQSYFVAQLSSGLMPSGVGNSQSSRSNPVAAMQSTAAIASWLLTVPSSLEPSTEKKVHSLLLTSPSSLDGRGLTVFGQVLRLLASLSAKEETNLIVEVKSNDDGNGKCFERLSELTVAHSVHLLARGNGANDTEHDRFALLASALLKVVSANEFDKKGYCFERLQPEHDNRNLNNEVIVCTRRDCTRNADNLPLLAEGIQDRAKCLVRALTSLTQLMDVSPEKKEGETDVQLLISSLFQLVLSVHFTTLSEESGDEDKVEPRKIDLNGMTRSERNELKIAATALLAELCENRSPSALLDSAPGNNESHAGVLRMLGLVIESAAARVEGDQTKNTKHVDEEELFSTTAIVLSLLVAVLEVGAEKRSNSDESFFKSLLSPLRVLSCGGLENDTPQSEEMTTMLPHLAEMASHAMALIAARGETNGSDNTSEQATPTKKSRMEAIIEKLSQAERDLQSSQPPLRAKGVVSLRHIARSLIDEGTSTVKVVPEKKGLITEIHEPKEVFAMDLAAHEGLAVVSRTLARTCLDALADSESYVYLASIQTLVAISDVCPAEIMPLMGLVIAKGEIDIDVATSDSVMASVRISLTQEQRIKATEALIFMMRRRGPAIFLYGLSLLEAMLFGPNEGPGEDVPEGNDEGDDPMFIQRQTHSYFTGDTDESETESGPQDSDEKNLRLNTGGPVYSTEENDVLRAGAISVVCELVSALDPSVVAAYSHHLVDLATNAMQLEASRPIRRAAASLARELYDCVMREVTSEDGSKAQCESTMAIAMVTAKEERMYNSLSRSVSADELAVHSKTRLVDPATQARCSEALETRQVLEDMGILQAAALIAQSLEQDLNDSKVQAVRRALS